MAKFQRFEDIEIWQIAVDMAVEVYLLCDTEPLRSDWGMKDQIRRAACSMSDNIAEGFEYNNNADFIRYLTYAKGSSGEFRNKLVILFRSGKIQAEIYEKLYARSVEFSSKTKALIAYLRKFEAEKKNK